jgi:ADP-ribosylglycohydrolase
MSVTELFPTLRSLPRADKLRVMQFLAAELVCIGDAFGQMFFEKKDIMLSMIGLKALPVPPWYLTDDSIMALSIMETLQAKGQIDQDYLAERFAINYKRNPRRGYGGMAHQILRSLYQGEDWRVIAPSVFDGMGSFGNGGAMRVAPLGAYFSDDIEQENAPHIKLENQGDVQLSKITAT